MRPAFDVRAYRDTLGCYATGVAVLTAVTPGGEHLGITVNSLTSVSLQPPLVALCLSKHLARFEALWRVECFNLSILREDQSALSVQFAGNGRDKWRGVGFALSRRGIRILEPHLALLECRRFQSHRAGDHAILIGQVERYQHDGAGHPLLFYRGRYHTIKDALVLDS
jgi:flavin reductase (DIM6/NTAB) family NADH-FMN oxidoreductase RutF